MNNVIQLEDSVSRSRSKHEGEPSASVCDSLSRTRAVSQRQLPTDHDYAVPTREYQLDQSSPLPATAAADPVLEIQRQRQKQPHQFADVDRVTPYQCPVGRQTGMYGPPPCCKRKVKVTGWSAQMYAALVGAVAPGQDGMRCALFPISNAALKDFFRVRVFRAPGSTVVPSHCSPADLAGKYNS